MTFLKKALAGARPERDPFDADTKSTGVLIGILALIFAPIAIAHVVCLADASESRPAVVEQAR
jgi:hypothetical protein